MMKICVTGGAGYIGSVIVTQLLLQGFKVKVYDKCLFGGEGLLGFSEENLEFISGDICDADQLRTALKGVDTVVHLAALVGEKACNLDIEETKAINITGAKNVYTLAAEKGVKRFIFLSTCSNYGISSLDELATEEAELRPLTLYAETKVILEKMILSDTSSMSKTILRFGTICGLSPRMRFDLLVNDLARAVALDLPIQIYSPDAYRPFLHIQDAARAITHCLNTNPKELDQQVFNVISENYKKGDLIPLVQKHYPEKKIEIVESSLDPRDYRVSANLIKDRIGFAPKYSVEDAFLEIIKAVSGNVFRDPMWPGHSSVLEKNLFSTI